MNFESAEISNKEAKRRKKTFFASPLRSPEANFLTAGCEKLAKAIEFRCQSRADDARVRFESRTRQNRKGSVAVLNHLRRKRFKHAVVDGDLNVAAQRRRNLRVVGESRAVGCDVRVRQSAGLVVFAEGANESDGDIETADRSVRIKARAGRAHQTVRHEIEIAQCRSLCGDGFGDAGDVAGNIGETRAGGQRLTQIRV